MKYYMAILLGSTSYVTEMSLDKLSPSSVDEIAGSFTQEVRDLGVILIPTVNWCRNVTSACDKVSHTMYQLRSNNHFPHNLSNVFSSDP